MGNEAGGTEGTEAAVERPSRAGPDRSSIPVETAADHHARQALGWAAILAFAAVVWIALPVAVGILFGSLLAFTAQPAFERLARRIGERWSALATVIASSLLFAGSVGGLSWLVVSKGTVLTRAFIDSLGEAPARRALDAVGHVTGRIGITSNELASHARSWAEGAAGRAEAIAGVLVSATASAMLGLFFAMLSMHYTLRNWQSLELRAEESLPLRPEYTAELFAEFRRVGRTTLLGTVATGVAQGVLGAIGFWICGLPDPVFFGAATAVASLIPAVGTMLVWMPAGIALIAIGEPGRGILQLVWGFVVVVGISDYVIRPRLVRGEAEVPALVTFTALFGGVEVLGLEGLIVGPVVMSLALAVLRTYATEVKRVRKSRPEPEESRG